MRFGVAVAMCAILFFVAKLSWTGNAKLPAPQPDKIATSTASDDTLLIKNETAGYAITVPRNWYLEKGSGSGMTVYPDYDAAHKTPPYCKIEISALLNSSRAELPDWLAAYFHRDPTADILEISRTTTTISGVMAIVWHGVLNGVSSTLAYVATGTAVYEIAPSTIMETNGAAVSANCMDNFENVVRNFHFEK